MKNTRNTETRAECKGIDDKKNRFAYAVPSKDVVKFPPAGYSNRGWLSAGERLASGSYVRDISEQLDAGEVRRINYILSIRNRFFDDLDRMINEYGLGLWFSHSEKTPVAEVPLMAEPASVSEDYEMCSILLDVVAKLLENDLIERCPIEEVSGIRHKVIDAANIARYYHEISEEDEE